MKKTILRLTPHIAIKNSLCNIPVAMYRFGLILCLSITQNSLAAEKLESIQVIGESQSERRENIEEMFFKPYSKDIIGEKTIEEEGTPDIAEAVKDIPGVNVTEQGSFNKSIKIRGLSGSRVSSLINGIKLSNQGMSHSGAGELGMIDISNVKTIEVIKGSPSVLYDPGASGGVINVITHTAPIERGLSFKQRLSYDDGYNQKKSTTIIKASTGTISARALYTISKASDYKIKENTKEIIKKQNDFAEMSASENSVLTKDLGYNTTSFTGGMSAKLGEDSILTLDIERFLGKDMVIIHGSTIESVPNLIQYNRMDRDSESISYRKEQLADLSNIHLRYNQQKQRQLIGTNGEGVKLNSKQFNLASDWLVDDFIFKFGGEIIKDDAETNVYSIQDYYAGFLSAEFLANDKLTFFGGLRWNSWTTKARYLPNENEKIACELEGNASAACQPAEVNESPTIALGIMYSINDQNNISVNLNTTYRNPDLLELYSFSSNYFGNFNLKPEEGNHAEISWKYLNDQLSLSTSLFYSEFTNYILTSRERKLNDGWSQQQANNHIFNNCNPLESNEEYDRCYSEAYRYVLAYYNSEHVTNQGLEIKADYTIPQHEISFVTSFNEMLSKDKYVISGSNPIDINFSYRYEFANDWKPWIKIKSQYTIDYPKVKQHGGFEPYLLNNLYAGFKKNDFTLSSGIRNLTDSTYRPAYSGINGLSRTFFVNVTYEWNSN